MNFSAVGYSGLSSSVVIIGVLKLNSILFGPSIIIGIIVPMLLAYDPLNKPLNFACSFIVLLLLKLSPKNFNLVWVELSELTVTDMEPSPR